MSEAAVMLEDKTKGKTIGSNKQLTWWYIDI